MTARVLLLTLAGLAAALGTVLLTDVLRLIPIPEKMTGLTSAEARQHILGAVAFGTLLGAFLAAAGAVAKGGKATARVVLLAIPIGAAVAFVGVNFGMTAMAPLYADPARNTAQFLGNVIARGIAWAVIGGWVGAGDGIRQRSVPVVRNGVIGGIAGGFAGGVLFEIIPWLLPGLRTGAPSRLVGFSATGALIGLLTGLVRALFSEAWVKLAVGRNEYKDILLERLENTIGRHELCDIPLYGDPSIARHHAVLRRTPAGWEMVPAGADTPVFVDNQPIAGSRQLRTGSRIRVGAKEMVFEERKVRTPTTLAPREAAPAANPFPGQPNPTSAFPTFPAQTLDPTRTTGARNTFPNGTSPTGAPSARLVATSGPHAGAVFPLITGAIVGRDPGCTLALPADTKASRRHAALSFQNGTWRIVDQNSTNGTWVNGQRVADLALAHGDTIVVGESTLRFEG